MSQVGCGVFAGVVGTRVNGQGSAPVSTLEPLSDTLRRALLRSKLLVVVVNRGTLEQPNWVRTEVETFRAQRPAGR